MKLDDLRVVAALSDARSLSGAARKLGMPKQTLSRRLQRLEQELGIDLVHRSTRRLRFTEAGQAFAERSRHIVALADEATEAVKSTLGRPTGRLRITSDPIVGEAFLPGLIATFLERYPEVEVDAVLTSRLVDLVGEGFDVALRIGTLTDSSLIARRLAPARLSFVAAPSYLAEHAEPVEPNQLSQHTCVVLAPDTERVRWPFRGPKGPLLLPVTGRLQVNSLAMARRAALAGIGIANLPAFACEDDVAQGRLVRLLETHAIDAGSLFLVYPKHQALAPKVVAFAELCLSPTSWAAL